MKSQKIQRILYILLILFCVGFYIFDIVVNHVDPMENLTKFVLIIACCVIGILRGNRSRGRASLSFYEQSYAKELGNAFGSSKKERKQLLCAVRFYNENNFKKAAKMLISLKNACKYPDDYSAVGLFLALCFTDMHLYEEAINEYQQLLSQRLETGRIYNNLGNIYSRVGRKKDAMENYEKSVVLSPDNEFTYVNIANMHFEDKNFESAITYALKALDINSKQKQAANLLAIVYALQEDKENADKYFHVAKCSGSNPSELKDAIDFYKADL